MAPRFDFSWSIKSGPQAAAAAAKRSGDGLGQRTMCLRVGYPVTGHGFAAACSGPAAVGRRPAFVGRSGGLRHPRRDLGEVDYRLGGWMNATGDERQQAYVRLIHLHRDWQAAGARLICTMDDLGSAGRPGTERANFYETWEIRSPEIVHNLLDGLWSNKTDLPLTKHFSIKVSVGKPIISMERDLGGPQLATTAKAEGEMPPIPQ